MERRSLLLGLDIGTSRCKGLLVDQGGDEVAAASAPTPIVGRGDRREMTFEALQSALARVLDDLGPARAEVAGIGIAGMAESGAPLDGAGRPLAPVIAWHDPRGREAVALLEERFGDELSHNLGQPIRTVSSVAKLGWLVDHGMAGIRRWLGVPELCLFALTGAETTDPSLAARTGAYDIVRRRWMEEVPASLGFPVEVFPAVQPAGSVMGRLREGSSGWTGLPTGVPVTLAGHDHLAALIGSGAAVADFGNSVGTAESVVAFTATVPELDRALARRVAVTLAPSGEGWAVLAGAARAGTAISFAASALGSSPPELDRQSEGAPGVDRPDLLPGVLAGDVTALRSAPPGEIWKELLRALAERTWEGVERAAAVVGAPRRLVVFGGGATSRAWLGAKADLATAPVWRSTAGEAAARGAALTAGVAAGWWPSPAEGPPAALAEVSGSSREGAGSGTTARP